MALTAATVWEVRSTGSDTNGGGFDPALGGTDYSQQNSAQATGTVTSVGTTVTATTGIFTSVMVGNLITDGTTWKEITAFTSATIITVDSAPSWTAATIKVGGALATLTKAAALIVAGNWVWVQTGTYTLTSGLTITVDRSGSVFPKWEGYATVRGDELSPPTISAGALTGTTLITLAGFYLTFRNFVIDGISNTVGTNNRGLSDGGSNTNLDLLQFKNCYNIGYQETGATNQRVLTRCLASTCTNGFNLDILNGDYTVVIDCVAANCGGYGFSGKIRGVNCIAYGNAANGFDVDYGVVLMNCTAYGNGSNGFNLGANAQFDGSGIYNCVSINNSGFGFNAASPTQHIPIVKAATFGNTSGGIHGLTDIINPVTLSGNPFTNATGGDFSLNTTAGAGALCRAAGMPGVFPGGLTTGFLDIGAVQSSTAGGGGTTSVYSMIF